MTDSEKLEATERQIARLMDVISRMKSGEDVPFIFGYKTNKKPPTIDIDGSGTRMELSWMMLQLNAFMFDKLRRESENDAH